MHAASYRGLLVSYVRVGEIGCLPPTGGTGRHAAQTCRLVLRRGLAHRRGGVQGSLPKLVLTPPIYPQMPAVEER